MSNKIYFLVAVMFVLLASSATATLKSDWVARSFDFENNCVDDTGTEDCTKNNGAYTTNTSAVGSYSVYLDGINDYVDTNYGAGDFALTTNWSISFWYQSTNGCPAGDQFYMGQYNSGTGLYLYRTNSAFKVNIYTGGGLESAATSTCIERGAWYHVVVAKKLGDNINAVSVYINGTSQSLSTTGTTIGMLALDNDLFLGARANVATPDQYLKGNYDQVIFWTKTLSENDAIELYNAGSGIAYPFTTSGITLSNWNVTTVDGVQEEAERNDWATGTVNITRDLLSFTVTSSVSTNMSCRLGSNGTYNEIVTANSNYKAATTETTSHAYTVYDYLPLGASCLYCAFIDGSGNEKYSGCLNVERKHVDKTFYDFNVIQERSEFYSGNNPPLYTVFKNYACDYKGINHTNNSAIDFDDGVTEGIGYALLSNIYHLDLNSSQRVTYFNASVDMGGTIDTVLMGVCNFSNNDTGIWVRRNNIKLGIELNKSIDGNIHGLYINRNNLFLPVVWQETQALFNIDYFSLKIAVTDDTAPSISNVAFINNSLTQSDDLEVIINCSDSEDYLVDYFYNVYEDGVFSVHGSSLALVYDQNHTVTTLAAASVTDNTNYTVEGWCGDLTYNSSKTNISILIDESFPLISSNLDGNSSSFGITLNLEINASDLKIENVLINDSCGNNYYNSSPSTPFYYDVDFDISNVASCPLGTQYSNVTVCDTKNQCTTKHYSWNHTAQVRVYAFSYLGSTINNFSVYKEGVLDGSTTEGYYDLVGLESTTYTVSVDATGYEFKSKNYTALLSYDTLNFSLYYNNGLYLTFRNENTKSIVNNVDIEFISDIYSNNFSTSNGTLYKYLLSPNLYSLRYISAGYSERFYYFDLGNRTHTNLTLYLAPNSTTEVTATVYDEVNNLVEDAYIKVQKYEIDTNTYDTVEIAKTNFEGETRLNLYLNTEFYRFLIEYPQGTLKKTTSPTYIYSDTLNFQIILGEDVASDFYTAQGVAYSLTFSEATNNFRFIYSDSDNVLSRGCLEVWKISLSGNTLWNSSCSSSSSSTILLGVQNSTGSVYEAKAYIYPENNKYFLDSLIKEFKNETLAGSMFVMFFFGVIMVLIFAFMSRWSISLAVMLTPVPLIIGSAINLININIGIAIGLEVLAIIIGLIISKNG